MKLGTSTSSPRLDGVQRALVERHQSLAERAARISSRRSALSFDELRSLGHRGLVEAALTFDPALGVPFEGFAWSRVFGAVRTGSRKEHAHRRGLASARAAAQVFAEATIDDADPLSVTEIESRREHQAMCEGFVAAFVTGWLAGAERSGPEDALIDAERRQRVATMLARALNELPARDRMILERHWDNQEELDAIARDMGVGYSTLRRYHQAALKRLGARLRSMGMSEMIG